MDEFFELPSSVLFTQNSEVSLRSSIASPGTIRETRRESITTRARSASTIFTQGGGGVWGRPGDDRA